MIYKYVVHCVTLAKKDNRVSELGLLLANTQLHQETITIVYQHATFEVSGREWCTLRAVPQQKNPPRMSKAAKSVAAAHAILAARSETQKIEQHAEIWGYHTKGLLLDSRMAKIVQHWDIGKPVLHT